MKKILHKMKIFERISTIIEKEGISVRSFESNIGCSNGTISKCISKGSDISSTWVTQIVEKYPRYNPDWLLTGKGAMLKSEGEATHKHTHSDIKLIPFYDINAEAGTMQISNMDAVSQPDEWIDAGDWFRDADSAMRVHGDSMFPVYKSGSIVVMREVRDKTLIIYGQDYVLETSEYRVIKRIQKSNEKGNWLACSVNEEVWEKGDLAGRLIHEPFDININNVHRVFRVLGCVSRTESSRIIYANKQN